VLFKGKPLINWVFDAMKPLCREIIIIAHDGDFSHLDARVYPDNYPGTGPAAGIEAGLSHCLTPLALISSCDTPNLSTELFEHLIARQEGFDISIASHDETNEPLIGVYSQSVHAIFLAAILSGDPHPPRIIRQCKWQEIPVSGDSAIYRPDLFLNLNSPSDLIS